MSLVPCPSSLATRDSLFTHSDANSPPKDSFGTQKGLEKDLERTRFFWHFLAPPLHNPCRKPILQNTAPQPPSKHFWFSAIIAATARNTTICGVLPTPSQTSKSRDCKELQRKADRHEIRESTRISGNGEEPHFFPSPPSPGDKTNHQTNPNPLYPLKNAIPSVLLTMKFFARHANFSWPFGATDAPGSGCHRYPLPLPLLRHSSFVILSSFVIRHSSFGLRATSALRASVPHLWLPYFPSFSLLNLSSIISNSFCCTASLSLLCSNSLSSLTSGGSS
jgi:hypothetical protein